MLQLCIREDCSDAIASGKADGARGSKRDLLLRLHRDYECWLQCAREWPQPWMPAQRHAASGSSILIQAGRAGTPALPHNIHPRPGPPAHSRLRTAAQHGTIWPHVRCSCAGGLPSGSAPFKQEARRGAGAVRRRRWREEMSQCGAGSSPPHSSASRRPTATDAETGQWSLFPKPSIVFYVFQPRHGDKAIVIGTFQSRL
jgi:hypothetical protein